MEKSTGAEFPEVLDDGKELAGAGVRKKAILGLKNISVYAFGVYSHAESVRQRLGSKYGLGDTVTDELPRDLYADAISFDVSLTVRLVIVYGRLKMASVRSSFEESLGARINRFGGAADRPLLTKYLCIPITRAHISLKACWDSVSLSTIANTSVHSRARPHCQQACLISRPSLVVCVSA